jgi:hypothetical protein
MALQRGDLGTNDVTAWAGHWQLRESLTGSWTPKITGEYNYASGDKDPTDGKRQTFDQLYPTPHDKYGLADQVGWKNLHHVRTGFEITPLKGMPITTNYHSWWLAEERDALYNVASAPIARIITGAANSHVGQELDVQVSKAIFPQLQVAAGYAHIFTGAFLKEATPGASYSHPYIQATYVFIARRVPGLKPRPTRPCPASLKLPRPTRPPPTRPQPVRLRRGAHSSGPRPRQRRARCSPAFPLGGTAASTLTTRPK